MGALEDITDYAKVILRVGVTDDTSVHQMNRLYCVVYLIILAMLISANQYVGKPINCYCPPELKRSQLDYIHSYCWVTNTYVVPFEESIPSDDSKRKALEIRYYQWVPLIFVFQAFLFYMPRMFWKRFSSYSGLHLKKVLRMANASTYESQKERSITLDNLASFLDKWIEIRDCVTTRNRKVMHIKQKLSHCGISLGNFLCFLFVITGFLYLANSVGQFLLLGAILGNDFSNLGPDFVERISKNEKWEDLHRFPRVTYCDFAIRQLNNVQTWTVQCSLPINLFNEKLFTTLWFLLVGMIIVNSINVIQNAFILFAPSRKHQYIKKYYRRYEFSYEVRTNPNLPTVEKQFVDDYLKQDGVFIVWLISQTSSPVTADELVSKLIASYLEKPGIKEFLFPAMGDMIV